MHLSGWWSLALFALLLLVGPARAETTRMKGSLVFAGGALRFNNAPVWERFVELAGGKGARIVVVPAAAGNPRKSGQAVVENLQRYGARAEMVLIAPRLKDVDFKVAARDPANVAKLREAGGIWFIGGDQERITKALLNKDGSQTPTLTAIWAAYRDGAVLGGSSAGTAIMSRFMFADAMNSLDTLKFGVTKGKHMDVGLGFVGNDWFVDQHFLARGRFARSLLAMRDYGYKFGIGVDENTAVVFKDGRFDVVGYTGVLVLDLSDVKIDPLQKAFNMKGVRLTYLDAGDSMDARTRKVTVSRLKTGDRKVDPRAKGFDPSYDRPEDFCFSNMLAPGVIFKAVRNALDSKPGVVKGLAFAQPEGGKRNDLGFAFRVYRSHDTIGWYTGRGGYEAYTVLNAYLDITPVKMANPLFSPLKP